MKNRWILISIALCLCFSTSYAQIFNEILGSESSNPNAGEKITTAQFNTIVGDSAGFNLTTANRTVLIGFAAGKNITTDFSDTQPNENVFIGYQAGYFTTNSTDNVFVGSEAGRLNTSGNDNTFVGTEAGENNTTGQDNTFLGEESGFSNTSGSFNVFVGTDAGQDHTTGQDNTFVGVSAGEGSTTGQGNTFIGGGENSILVNNIYPNFTAGNGSAGDENGTGNFNTYVGAAAGTDAKNTKGNTFVGYSAGGNTERSDECTFVGAFAGWDNNRRGFPQAPNQTGARNNYFGFGAGGTNRDGSDNIGIGHDADFSNDGDGNSENMRNVFIGNSTFIIDANNIVSVGHNGFIGQRANNSILVGSEANIAGENSIGIGYDADIAASADNAVGIGHQVDVDGLQATAIGSNTVVSGTNSSAIGYQASVTANNEIFLGNSAIASIGGVVNWTATSDGRFKKNVQENVIGLDFINRLRPVTYNYDANKLHAQKGFETETLADALAQKEAMRYSGFIAQEVEAAAKQLDYDFSGVDAPQNEEEIYGLRYAEFVVPLVKAVQELSAENEAKDQLIAQQAAELAAYKKLLGNLTARVEALEMKENAVLSVAEEN